MIDLNELLTEFDITVLKTVYYINKEHENNYRIVPKRRTITSFMRCNEKSDHFEIYKKYPDVSKKYSGFRAEVVDESLAKLVRQGKVELKNECYYCKVYPDGVPLTCYGRLLLSQARVVATMQKYVCNSRITIEENMKINSYEVSYSGKIIFKVYFFEGIPYVTIGKNDYRLSCRRVDYDLYTTKLGEKIKDIKKLINIK